MSEFRFDEARYPTMARVESQGFFESGIMIMMKAMSLLTDEVEIVDFAHEISLWLGEYHGDSERGVKIASEWISYVSGHMGEDEIIDRWQNALPQTDVNTGFMPDDRVLRVRLSGDEDSGDIIRNAIQHLISRK